MLKFLDWFFILFHSALIIFNVFGWIFRQTRKINLFTLVFTGLSWSILGFWYGFGYCPLTDFHWKVLYRLGVNDLPDSYIKYLIDRLAGTDLNPEFVDVITGIVYFAALTISVIINARDFKRSLRKQ